MAETAATRPASMIRDITLAPSGHQKIAWARDHMPVMNMLRQEFVRTQPLKGLTVTMCLHLEAKTAYLAQTLQAAGGDIVVCASNPLSTQDDVVAALVDSGITAFAWYGATMDEYEMHLTKALDCLPNAIIDDGADLVGMLHKHRQAQAKTIIGACEETTTGIKRIKSMDAEGILLFPMVAVNDAMMKYLFDNRYGTGQSVWAICCKSRKVWSRLPSSTNTSSNVSATDSMTAVSRLYISVTLSCSLWNGTTIEYFSTVKILAP
jgi:adenosylhomocysteinase